MIELGINDLFIEAGSYGYTLKQRKMVKDKQTRGDEGDVCPGQLSRESGGDYKRRAE